MHVLCMVSCVPKAGAGGGFLSAALCYYSFRRIPCARVADLAFVSPKNILNRSLELGSWVVF